MNPDYSKYTILELEDVLDNIDRTAYPDRYERAKEEYNRKANNPQVLQSEIEAETINSKERKLYTQAIISFILLGFFLVRTIDALYSGTIRFKTGPIVDLIINPEGFYFILFWHVVFVAFSLYLFCKSFTKKNA